MHPDDQKTTRYFRVALVAAWVSALWFVAFFIGLFPLAKFDLSYALGMYFTPFNLPVSVPSWLLPLAFFGTFRQARWVTLASIATAASLSWNLLWSLLALVASAFNGFTGNSPVYLIATVFSLAAVIGLWVTLVRYRKVEQSYPPKKVAQ